MNVFKENENTALDIDNNQTFKNHSQMNVEYEYDKSPIIFDNNSICLIENHKTFKVKSENFSANNDEIKVSNASHKQSRVTESTMDKNLDNYEVIRRTNNGTSTIIYKSLVCPFTSSHKYQIIKHCLTHRKNRNYNCLDCNFTAKCLFLLKRHRKTHVENHFECPLCKFSATSINTMRAHRLSKHRNQIIKSLFTASKLHKRSTVPRTSSVCNQCTLIFRDVDSYLSHIKTCHTSLTKCKKIKKNRSLSSTGRQSKEILNVKTGKSVKIVKKKYKCGKCCFFTDNVVNLSTHKRTHLKSSGKDKHLVKNLSEDKVEKPESHLSQTILSCNNCSFTTTLKIVLLKHKQSHVSSPTGVFKCTECPFSVSNNKYLNSHLMTHAYKYLYRCKYCNFSTNNKATLRSHHYSHRKLREKTNYRLYCKNKITVKLQAKNNKTFKCFSCDYSCSSEYLLNQHSLTHLEYKLFKCVHCDYETNFKGNYVKHVLIHVSEYRPCGFINETEIKKKNVTDGLANKNSTNVVKSPNLADVNLKCFVVLNKCPNLQAEKMKLCRDNENATSAIDNIPAFKEQSQMKNLNMVEKSNNRNHNVSGKNALNWDDGNSVRDTYDSDMEKDDTYGLANISSKLSQIDLEYDDCPSYENQSPNIFNSNLISPIENHKKFKKSQTFSYNNEEEIEPSHNSPKQSRITKSTMDKILDNYEVIRRTNNGTSTIVYKSLVCPYTNSYKHQIIKHCLTHRKDRNYNCLDCNFTAKCLFLLKRHKKTHVENHFECPLCQFSTTSLTTLKSHRSLKHRNQNSKSFYTASKLRKRSLVYGTFNCKKCSFTTRDVDNYKKHMKICLRSLTKNMKIKKKLTSSSVSAKRQMRSTGKGTKGTSVKTAKSANFVKANDRYRNLTNEYIKIKKKATSSPVSAKCQIRSGKRTKVTFVKTAKLTNFVKANDKYRNLSNEYMKIKKKGTSSSVSTKRQIRSIGKGTKGTLVKTAKSTNFAKANDRYRNLSNKYMKIKKKGTSSSASAKCQIRSTGKTTKGTLLKTANFVKANDRYLNLSNVNMNCFVLLNKCPNLQTEETKVFGNDHGNISSEIENNIPTFNEESQMDVEYDDNSSTEITTENHFQDLNREVFDIKEHFNSSLDFVKEESDAHVEVNDSPNCEVNTQKWCQDEKEFDSSLDLTIKEEKRINQECDDDDDDCPSYEVSLENQYHDLKTEYLDDEVDLSLDLLRMETIKHESLNQNGKQDIESPSVFESSSISPIESHKNIKGKLQNLSYYKDEEIKLNHNSYKQDIVNKSPMDKSLSGYEIIKTTNSGTKTIFFKSLVCPFITIFKSKIIQHCNTHEKNRNYDCLDNIIVKIKFKCDTCNFVTDNVDNLSEHKRTHTNLSVKDPSKDKLEEPESHLSQSILACNSCSFKTSLKIGLLKHKQSHVSSPAGVFKCTECSFSASNNKSLICHLFTHAYKYLYGCRECNFSSNNKATLKLHKNSHTKRQEKINNRVYHKNKIRVQPKNKKVFKCHRCNYSCYSEYLLNQHSVIHLENKLFKCVHCDYETNFKGNLTKHVLTHVSEYRPWGS